MNAPHGNTAWKRLRRWGLTPPGRRAGGPPAGATMPVRADLPVHSRRTCRAPRRPPAPLVMSWPEVAISPEPRGEWRICTAVAPGVVFTVRRYGDIGPAQARGPMALARAGATHGGARDLACDHGPLHERLC